MPTNRVIKELEPVYLKITPSLLEDYSSASCVGKLTPALLGEVGGIYRIAPWWDEDEKKHFCYKLEIELCDSLHRTKMGEGEG